MNAEPIFRLVFTFALFAMWAGRLYFHRLAETHKEGVSTAYEGPSITVLRVIGGLIMIAYPLAYVLQPGRLEWSFVARSVAVGWLGVALTILGTLGILWTTAALRRNFSTNLRVRDDHTLIENGPYRAVRHPMYTAILLTLLGWMLLMGSWVVALLTVVYVGLIMIMRAPREEAMLLQAFGEDYRAYMARTGRFLPAMRRQSWSNSP